MIFVVFCQYLSNFSKSADFFVWFWASFCVVLNKLGIPICVVLDKKKSWWDWKSRV